MEISQGNHYQNYCAYLETIAEVKNATKPVASHLFSRNDSIQAIKHPKLFSQFITFPPKSREKTMDPAKADKIVGPLL